MSLVVPINLFAQSSAFQGLCRDSLAHLQKRGIDTNGLAPEDLAKAIYFAHHEGVGGVETIVRGRLTQDQADHRLKKQIKEKARELIDRFEGDAVNAYHQWLFSYIDTHINVTKFMVNPNRLKPKGTNEIVQILGGKIAIPPTRPKEVPEPTTSPPTQMGAAEGWHDPLDSCTLRTARLASRRSATFGMVRNGGTKAHQGIDLVAVPGTPIYAVANGKIENVRADFNAIQNYGASIILAVDIYDLPPKQKLHYQNSAPNTDTVYFFYAHLNSIQVKAGDYVKAGQIIGESGESGNAKGMDTINKGAHLHFEARNRNREISRSLGGRLDPLPFLVNCN